MKRSNTYSSARTNSQYRASPMLGVIVMVAVTVILVAVLGVFSFGVTLGSLTTPQASLSTQLSVPNDQITISHIGGDSLSARGTALVITNESDGHRMRFGPTRTDDTFEVGDAVVISTSRGTIEGWQLAASSQSFRLQAGATYSISLIDTDSDTPIYRTSLTTI